MLVIGFFALAWIALVAIQVHWPAWSASRNCFSRDLLARLGITWAETPLSMADFG